MSRESPTQILIRFNNTTETGDKRRSYMYESLATKNDFFFSYSYIHFNAFCILCRVKTNGHNLEIEKPI